MSKMDRIKKMLLRSSTMPRGSGQAKEGSPLNVLQSGQVHTHKHKADGSCCGGLPGHDHDHEHDEEDVTNPRGGCC